MIIRIVDILVVLLIGGFGIWWLLNTYVFAPRKEAQDKLKNTTTDAIESARVDYLEIRRAWKEFYVVSRHQEFYADAMDDMSIPEVAKFQRLMVPLNQEYNDLKNGTTTDETFVGKAVLLRELFDDAVRAAKKQSLTDET